MTATAAHRPGLGRTDPYEGFAAAYDVFSRAYRYDRWLERIEQIALAHGLCGRRVLDVACGTGKSFLPLLDRGYEVRACDVSAAMVEVARSKADRADVFVADMRSLPAIGPFDLITCLDDAVNYLLAPDDLVAMFGSIAKNLAAGGVMVFDLNTRKTYGDAFASQWHIDDPAAFVAWEGRADPGGVPDRYEAHVVAFTAGAAGDRWTRTEGLHRQRYWPIAAIEQAARAAGLSVAAVYGQRRGVRIDARVDETVHDKSLYVITHDHGKDGERIMQTIEP